jgi:hypothetical protein
MSTPTQPGWAPPQPPTPKPKRHLGRNITLAVVGLFILGGIISAIDGGGTTGTQATTPAVTEGPTSPSADTGASAAVDTTPAATEPPATQPVPKPVRHSFSGSGNWNSPPFVLKAESVKVTFAYSGNYLGGTPSNFIASLEAADDSLPIVNDIGGKGGKTTTLYPSSPGSRYHLEIMADGHWTVTVQEVQ